MSQNYINIISESDQDFINSMPKYGWRNQFWQKFTGWNNQHQLLSTSESPCISTSTTVTNFESVESLTIPVGSNNTQMCTLEKNLKMAQPEIVPLQLLEKEAKFENTKGSINDNSFSVYSVTVKPKVSLFNQVITALSISLVSMVVGFVSAFTSPAAESMKRDLGISDEVLSWVGGLMPLGALIGGLVGGQMIEYLGRKLSLLLTNIMLILSWILVSVAANEWYLYVGRAIAGFSVGIASLAMPVYLGETIQPEVRGTLGLLPTGFGNIGILFCFIVGTYIEWNQLAWVGIALPFPFVALAFLIPETPKWYISKNKYEQARKSLQWLRGKNADIEYEFSNLANTLQRSSTEPTQSLSVLFKSSNVIPFLISLGLMFFQQMSGINAVIFYTSDIFEMAGSKSIDKNTSTIIVGVVNFVSTFIATVLIDRLGRKILLYISSILMVLTLGALGTYFYLHEIGVDVSNIGWFPLTSFVVYVLGFSLGFGPIPWLMMGEILPAKIRGSAASVVTAFNWSCTFIVTKTFVDIVHGIGPHGAFWMFGIICALSLGFVIIWVPETQGQSLEEIESKLAGLKVRRMSSAANLKPLPSTF